MRPRRDLAPPYATCLLSLLTTLGVLIFLANTCRGQSHNLARDASYEWDPAPNYAASTDPADAQQLTDGHRLSDSRGWTRKAMVAWGLSAGARVSLTLDLGRPGRVTEIVLSTRHAADSGVVPPSLLVALSQDGATFHWAGAYDNAALRDLDRDGSRKIDVRIPLAVPTTARWVQLIAMLQGDFLVVDEIEVFGSEIPSDVTSADIGSTAPPVDDSASFGLGESDAQAAQQRKLWSVRRHLPDGPSPQQQFPWISLEEEEKQRFAWRARAWRDASPHRADSSLGVQRVAPLRPRNRWSPPGEPEQDTLQVVQGNWSALAFDVWSTDAARSDIVCRVLALPAGIRATLRNVVSVEGRNEQWRDDALPRLRNPLSLLPGQSAQIWVDIDATAAAPGNYILQFAFQDEILAVPVRIHPRHQAVEPPLATVNWTYPNKQEALRNDPMAAIRDNLAAGINSWILDADSVPWPDLSGIDAAGDLRNETDFSNCDRVLAQYEAAGPIQQVGWFWLFWIEYNDPSVGRLHHPYFSDEWKRALELWLSQWMQHLEQRGYATDRYFMQILDERGGQRATQLYRQIKTMKPQLRLALTFSRAQSNRELQDLLPWLDIAILGRETLSRRGDFIDRMHARGGAVWVYDVLTPAKTASPEESYRMLAWEAWAMGLQGCAFWSYASITGDSWDDFDGKYPDYAVIYNNTDDRDAHDEPYVPSKRWRAFRMGIQDVTLFAAVQAELPELRQQVRQAVQEASLRSAVMTNALAPLQH